MLKYVSYPLLVVLILLAAIEFWPALTYFFNHFSVYQWMIYGIAGYAVLSLIPSYKKNVETYQTFSHEAAHMFVSVLFLQKIHSFHVDQNGGYIQRSSRYSFPDIFIGLAPYCFPFFTYVFLFFRIFSASRMLCVFDVFIGLTLAFHVSCFWKQTRLYQTDIQKHGYIHSFLFLSFFWLFNASIILLSIRRGMFKAMGYVFSEYWETIADFFKMLFS